MEVLIVDAVGSQLCLVLVDGSVGLGLIVAALAEDCLLYTSTTKLDRADMEKAKDLFYDIFGWDKTTGVPTRETRETVSYTHLAHRGRRGLPRGRF